jgi:hypothetical protein
MTVIPRLIVGGSGGQLPTDSFTVTGGAYGSTGSLVGTSSIKAMADAGVDIVAASIAAPGSLPIDVYVSDDDPNSEAFGDTHLFSGEYVTGDFDYDNDSVTIHARDWAGPLVDQKRVLTNVVGGSSAALAPDQTADSGVSTQNQKLSQIVTNIATQFSLIPDLRLNQNISNADADVGAIFGNTDDTIMTSTPQTLWGILTKLARQSGNIVYVNAEKHLVFGEPGAGLETLALTYRQTGGGIPLIKCRVTHNPRRNLTFRVMVLSYDPTLAQITTGQAYVIGSNYSTSDGGTVHAGAWGGAQASQIAKAVGTGSGSKKNAIPIYTYHMDGLTASQAQSRAEAIAADIAKRELVAACEADVIPGMAPGQQATLSGLINPEFATHTYYVTAYHHAFSISKGGSKFDTSFTMLDRQPEGKGKAATKPAPVG